MFGCEEFGATGRRKTVTNPVILLISSKGCRIILLT